MTHAYYNEIDPKAAEWLRELIKAGHIAPGEVDERSITDVKASDLDGFTQCHFFAGIGIWSAALRLAGWPDDRPVWSGSCPCQDYSVAGKGAGAGGDRDLWPIFAGLIRERKPDAIFGEQVSAAIRFGWLDRVRTDLEAEAYAVGSVVLGAHSVGADHIRQRLFWVANAKKQRVNGTIGDAASQGGARNEGKQKHGVSCAVSGLADHDSRGQRTDGRTQRKARHAEQREQVVRLADMQREGPQGHAGNVRDRNEPGRLDAEQAGSVAQGNAFDLWRDSRWHQCRDGKARRIPTQPRLFPLADARTHKGYRVAALRGAGNAINLGSAAAFIGAAMEAQP